MKKNLVVYSLLGITLSLALGTPLLLNRNSAERVDGYSTSSLPTTIDLNDTSAANIRSYYSSLSDLDESERKGSNLLKNLKTILKKDQKYYSYDSGSAIWDLYCIVDRDWKKSPATSLPAAAGTYDSTTNKITGYKWGNNNSTYENPYLHVLYYNRDKENIVQAYGDHSSTTSSAALNREHIWPKGAGFDGSGQGGARGDIMHLWASNVKTNNIHNNYYYGYVSRSGITNDIGASMSVCTGNYLGYSATLGGTTKVFEPQDSDKGDIARAVFYMAARYNYLSNSDSDGIGNNNPNLTIVNTLSTYSDSGYTSSTTNPGKLGILTDLLAWHHADPVDEFEIHRNNLCYTNFTNNRNPFVDFPEWVDYIWGTVSYNGINYQSYSSNPTGYASPSSDTINGYNGGGGSDPVSVTGVTLTKDSTTIEVGGSDILRASVTPNNATNQSLTWTSSDNSVATVSSSGTVSGVAEGSATITVRTNDGGYTDTCLVTVTAASGGGGGDSGDISGNYTLYSGAITEGDYVVYYGGKAMKNTISSRRLTYSEVTPVNDSISNPDASIVWYIAADGNYWTLYNDAVKEYAASNGTNNQAATSSTLTDNARWTVSGSSTYEFVNKANSSNSVNANLRNNGTYGFACYSTSTGGALSLYKKTETVLSSIAVKTAPSKLIYNVGDEFDPTGLIITATYSDGSTDDISFEDDGDAFEFSPADNLQTSDTSVTITFGGKSTTQSITVNSNPTLTWTAPIINTYSGTTLTSTNANSWGVTYNNGSGSTTNPTYGQFSVKLGGTTISLPYTWQPADDGKTLCVSYSTLTSSTTTVSIAQSLKSILKETSGESLTSDLTFTGACGGSGTANDSKTWTVTSDAAESQYDSTKGVHYGTGKLAVEYIQLTSDSFTTGTITQVVVNASGASNVTGNVSVTVGGNSFGTVQSFNSTASNKTFTGNASAGRIVVRIYKNAAAVNAIYCKSVSVTYTTPGGSTNIANSVDHIEAQRAAVKYAKAFNAAMDTTVYCATNMSSAWSSATSAWNTFLSEAAALGSIEEEYAKNLIKYASAQWTDDTDDNYEYCLERALATYEKCVNTHGQTAFMSDVRTVGANANINHILVVRNNSSKTIFIIVILSLISITSISGYFFLKSRKKEEV